jgi:hypothetical protein
MVVSSLLLDRDGAKLIAGGVLDILREIHAALPPFPVGRAGLRLFGLDLKRDCLETGGAIGRLAESCLPGARPVRATLFDKSDQANWAVGWHQDRTISVADRREVKGFGPWTIKDGVQHVAPPFELLARMITLRIHLDDVGADNAPLQIAVGSHRLGRIAEKDVDAVVRHCGIETCLAVAGDVWAYATPILHASQRAAKPVHRRVLQVDYSADSLPGGLRWIGV